MNDIAEPVLESLLKGLNQDQKIAVTASSDSHTLVLAGAGCGKTTVLTKRIAFCMLSGIDTERICALTFTRKAAEEMVLRVAALDGIKNQTRYPLITTFHGLGLRVLSETVDGTLNFCRLGYSGMPRLLSERNRLEMLVMVSSKNERALLNADLFRLDSLLSQRSVFAEKQTFLSNTQKQVLKQIADRLEKLKREKGVWDFSDLITGLMQLFEENPWLINIYSKRFDAVLVDEFQDTNPVQIKLLHCLLSNGSSLFAVGDDDQAIYGFRGADIRPTIEFCNYFKGAKILKLQSNYRSVPVILDTANRLFINKDPAYRKVLVSARYTKKDNIMKPSVHRFENMERLVSWVMSTATGISMKNSIPVKEMAILFRVNQTLEWVNDRLKKMSLSDYPQLLTVHRSKGLEFPVVFLCDLEESVFPAYHLVSSKRIGSWFEFISALLKKSNRKAAIDCDWEEEKRLFYVAITRAQKYLFFLHARNKTVYGRRRRFEQSRLLKLL
jgi:superfamily I DNA/RNA helicase